MCTRSKRATVIKKIKDIKENKENDKSRYAKMTVTNIYSMYRWFDSPDVILLKWLKKVSFQFNKAKPKCISLCIHTPGW